MLSKKLNLGNLLNKLIILRFRQEAHGACQGADTVRQQSVLALIGAQGDFETEVGYQDLICRTADSRALAMRMKPTSVALLDPTPAP